MTEPVQPDPSPAGQLTRIAERPARLILMICQMILGLGLLIALVLKVYMAVLTDHVCTTETGTLGNAIRCMPTLVLMANVLALAAGIELARALFQEGLARIIAPIALALAAALLALLAVFPGAAGWREALLLLALVAAFGGIAWIGNTLLAKR